MTRLLMIAIAMLTAAQVQATAASYPVNFVNRSLGARVFTESRTTGPSEPDDLCSDGPISRGRFAFAPIKQIRSFTVDFGRPRKFDRIEFGLAGPRTMLNIEVSDSAKGPFRQVRANVELAFFQKLRTPLTTARCIRFDLGTGSNRVGVHSLRIYKGYEHPDLDEVTMLLHQRIKSEDPRLTEFHSRAEAGQHQTACSILRKYFSTTHKPQAPPTPDYDLTRARAVIEGNIDYAGLQRTDRPPIDWAYMETTDWYEHRNFLNRGSAVGVLADAAYHTSDPNWAERFTAVCYDWIDENPKPDIMSGPDYPTWRTLDTAARLSWLVSRFPQITVCPNIDDTLWANYLYSIWQHADYLKNDDFSGGNWLATITSSVTHTALEFVEFTDRRIWLEYGKTGFERNVMRDIHPDGKEMEDAPGYICMAYKAMLSTLEALHQENIAVDPEAIRRLDKVQDFLIAVTQPNGVMPSIGDWGGCEPYALTKALDVFDRADVRYLLSRSAEGRPASFTSVNFPDGLWTIMRGPWSTKPWTDAYHMVFKSSSGSHGHRDVLAITAYALGRELLIDPGIRSYEHADVERYLQTSYHNTVCIDQTDQPRGTGRTDVWLSNDTLDCVSGILTGYKALTHRRTVFFVKNDYWVVSDRISGKTSHRFDQNWHFPSDADPQIDTADSTVRTNWPDGANLLIVPVCGSPAACEQFEFFIAAQRMVSGKDNIPATGCRYTVTGLPPVAFDVVLQPWKDSQPPVVSLQPILTDTALPPSATALKITRANRIDYIVYSPENAITLSSDSEQLSFEGRILLMLCHDGQATTLAGRDIRKITFSGEDLLAGSDTSGDILIEIDQPVNTAVTDKRP